MDRMFRFGEATFWPDRHVLTVAGVPRRLGSRAIELLKVFVQSPGELLGRRQLVEVVWPDAEVDENNLAVQIANLRKVLGADAIATVARQGYRFCLPVVQAQATAPRSGAAVEAPSETALPHALSRFIGFEAERGGLARRLLGTRLMTLTGMGGSGKTRLAIEVAREAAPSFAHGVCFVDLAPLVTARSLSRTVATALGLREDTALEADQALLRELRGQHRLLVLDNCEHIVGGCAQLAERLLNAAPRLHVLATSRESLGVPGEEIVIARAMRVPAPPPAPIGVAQLRELLGFEAIELFVSQARQVAAAFELVADNAADVVEICRQLDGIPLALELAAARVRTMTVAQIAGKLDLRFRLLTRSSKLPTRHQTLLATLLWSYEQLSPGEQRLLQGLALFAGGCTLSAAAAVAGLGDEVEVADMLHTLVDKSLLLVEHPGPQPRYRLLETVRHFARDRAQAAGVEAGFARRHLGHFLRLAQTQNEALAGRAVPQAMATLHAEHANLESAQLACGPDGHGAALGIELANAMRRYWIVSGQYTRGRQFFAAALARTPDASVSRGRALACFGMAQLCHFSGHLDESWALAQQATTMARVLDDGKLLVIALDLCRAVQLRQSDLAGARASTEEALALARGLGDAYLWGIALLGLGEQQREEGAFESALQTFEQAQQEMQRHGNVANLGLPARNLAALHAVMGRMTAARAALAEAYRYGELVGLQHRAEQNLSVAARLAAACGDWTLAARVQGALDRYCEEIGAQVAATAACLARWADAPRQQLGETAYTLHCQSGRSLSLDAVTAEVRAWLSAPWPAAIAEPAARTTAGGLLTPREMQLLDLVARGFNYTEAAGILGLSLSTVRTHARNVYAKLDVHNKTEAVYEARQLGLLV
ncbi:MAG: winged helix-turn-helix domain-containing protein [Rubrivivax sp.]|nr:winged helix-turn-helix domain-containing protein [Rubrivivax sp.]